MSADSMNRFAEAVADKNGWSVQPDKELRADILQGLEKNKERYGFMLCPCRDSWGDIDFDRDIICPCIYAQKDIEEQGRCFCALFCRKGSDGFLDVVVKDKRPEELYP